MSNRAKDAQPVPYHLQPQLQFKDAPIQEKLAVRNLPGESQSMVAKEYLGHYFTLLEAGRQELETTFSKTELKAVVEMQYDITPKLHFAPVNASPAWLKHYSARLFNLSAIERAALADLIRIKQREASA
jgi:hypothetical protein